MKFNVLNMFTLLLTTCHMFGRLEDIYLYFLQTKVTTVH